MGRSDGFRILIPSKSAVRIAPFPHRWFARPELVCVDEYQHAPEIPDVIKAGLNRDGRAGRFVLAGSTMNAALPQAAQALTGRLHRLPVYPLSQARRARF